ncbi:hypothetical protein MPF_0695 [Methanohalophilus portucalensis FDF-1]|uniref:Uncharacterized protein n=1 Tax=Methanohalophilus portucalensis FDF-1 TaxID=523843 RepID=A0A1L9C604_9EURY|nr:hypothetical protein MPF_0695 [Methanohalophilus portucalensis FDF-1]
MPVLDFYGKHLKQQTSHLFIIRIEEWKRCQN